MKTRKVIISFLLSCPVLLLAFSTGPPINRTGAAVDGGVNCTACHSTFAPANSDPSGLVRIATGPYTPGVKQTVMVTVYHPLQKRWGFQLIARTASDETKQAGTFTVDSIVRVRCTSGDAPCNGGVEYAEHKSAPVTGVGAGYTFLVTWTPPATDVGEVHFYAAGNAANGDGNLTGDRIYTTKLFIRPAGPCNISLKPAIGSVVNGASFASAMSPNGMATIFGTNFSLAGSNFLPTAADVTSGFPKSFSCIAVEMNGVRVPIAFVGDSQINFQVPASAPPGPATVRVLLNPDTAAQAASDTAAATVQSAAPAFFTFGSTGVAATLPNSATPIADPAVAGGGVSVKPGDMITMWGTGFGPTNPAFPEGAIATSAATVTSTVVISIGGVIVPPADISYVGLSMGSISGLCQLNVKVPTGLPDGPATVVAQVNGASTQASLTIPVHQ